MAAASAGSAASSRALEYHRSAAPDFGADASSSFSFTSRAAEVKPVACEGGGEEDLLDLDTPWVAAAEAEAILEEEAAAASTEALKISGEAEQDEDEIRDNLQRQEDELMALEAIYGDDLAVNGNKGALRYFEIYSCYDVSHGVELCAKFSSTNVYCKAEGCSDGTGHGDGPDVFSYNCNFEHLPPLILTCLLPHSYPSKDPPYFTITAKWMDWPQVSQLCEMLDTIWAELPGQEVVYQWVEWLRDA